MSDVSLRAVTAATVRTICALEVSEPQKGFVAANAVSIAQAHFEPTARFNAIYAAEAPVGFLMWRPDPAPGAAYLWRFMIDRTHQRKGYAASALTLLCHELRSLQFRVLKTSVVLGEAGPLPFYRAIGFRESGEILPNGETGLSLAL